MRPEPPEGMQARHQAGPEPQTHRGVRRRAQGGLPQDQDQPAQGGQAGGEEVVLHAHQGVRPLPMKLSSGFERTTRLASFTR